MSPPESVPEKRPATSDQDEGEASEKRMSGGHDPRELARLSAETRRKNKAEADASDPTDAAIVRKLRKKAAGGDVAAARELREWSAAERDTELRGDAWLDLLSQEERDQLKAWIAQHKADAEAQRSAPV